MNTQNLSPGVYVKDVKPLGRPLTSPSMSTFGMFGRLSVRPPSNQVVAFDSFNDYLNRHLTTEVGSPFGSLILLRLALELPWDDSQPGPVVTPEGGKPNDKPKNPGVRIAPVEVGTTEVGNSTEETTAGNTSEIKGDDASKESQGSSKQRAWTGKMMSCPQVEAKVRADLSAIIANPAKLGAYGLQTMLPGKPTGQVQQVPAAGDVNKGVLELETRLIAVERAKSVEARVKALEALLPFKDNSLAWGTAADGRSDVEASLRSLALTGLSAYFFFQNGGERLVVVDTTPNDVTPAIEDDVLSLLYQHDVGLLAAPGYDGKEVIEKFCGRRDDTHQDGDPFCFGLIDHDGKEGAGDPGEGTADESVGYYAPWVKLNRNGTSVSFPPSPFVAGVIARTDSQFGPHYAPAGIDKEVIGAAGLSTLYSDAVAGRLNGKGVNCLRVFAGGKPVVFGCRTHSSNSLYWHIPVVRLLAMIRKTVKKQLRYVVHKPNTSSLRKSLVRDIYTYLEGLRRGGSLEGDSAEEAFFIQCDEQNNPPESRVEGRLNVRIAVAPVRPAEFIIVEVTQLQLDI